MKTLADGALNEVGDRYYAATTPSVTKHEAERSPMVCVYALRQAQQPLLRDEVWAGRIGQGGSCPVPPC